MNRLAKAGLAVGGAVAAVGALRRFLEPWPRYAPWEKPPYGEFPNKVLVLGGGFEEGGREPDEARSPETPEPDGRQGVQVGPEGRPR